MLDFDVLKLSTDYPDLISSLFGVFLTYCLSVIVAFTYVKTFLGLSYSRSYIQAMILGAIVVCCAMQAIGDNLARGLGMMGALSIIRFRTNLKEPRDMIFLFACLAIGIANGVHSYSIAIVATFGFCLAAVTLYSSPLNQNLLFDGLLRFSLEDDPESVAAAEAVLRKNCQRFSMVTLRESKQGGRIDYSYQVKLHRRITSAEMVSLLKQVESVNSVNFLLQSATVEV